jgi:iron-sulfur cluster insertion protein
MLNISDSATKKIKEVIDEEGNDDLKLRIFVQGGGCSGFQYGFTLDEKAEEDDFSFEKNGVQVLVDPMSMQYLQEAEIDYEKTLTSAEFKIKNPNVTATCGCGSSFTVN